MTVTSLQPGGTGPAHVLVVVPARDEEELLGRCLRAVGRARRELGRRRPGVRSSTVVVLDSCADGSAAVAAAHDCTALEVRLASVGAARAAGVASGRAAIGRPPHRVWVASTDADSEVPPDWLTAQVARAERGADLVLGAVRPDPATASPAVLAAWRARDRALDRRERVHGANLGARLSAYDRAGGFPRVPEHEDVRLVAALRRAGVREAAGPSVLTSARSLGRVAGGFAGYLRGLSADLEPDAVAEAPPAG